MKTGDGRGRGYGSLGRPTFQKEEEDPDIEDPRKAPSLDKDEFRCHRGGVTNKGVNKLFRVTPRIVYG